jgi:hypothetical protein
MSHNPTGLQGLLQGYLYLAGVSAKSPIISREWYAESLSERKRVWTEAMTPSALMIVNEIKRV